MVFGFWGSMEFGKNCIREEEASVPDFDPQFKRLAVSLGEKPLLGPTTELLDPTLMLYVGRIGLYKEAWL